MIAVLIWILVIVLIFGVAAYIIRSVGLDASAQKLALLVVGLICLIVLLYLLLSGVSWPRGGIR